MIERKPRSVKLIRKYFMREFSVDMRRRLARKAPNRSVVDNRKKPSIRSADFASQPFRTEIFQRRRTFSPATREAYFPGKQSNHKHLKALDGIRSFATPSAAAALSREERWNRKMFVSSLLQNGQMWLALFRSRSFALRLSMIGAVFFGMGSMAFIYHSLGKSALADNTGAVSIANPTIPEVPTVLGAKTDVSDDEDLADTVMNDFSDPETEKQEAFEMKLHEMVNGYPIDDMVPYIASKDRIIAAFLIGIAKKESAWGKRVPIYHGHDCFNYWGYRGKRRFMGSGGHTCFNSPEDAVNTVSRRLEKLVYSEKRDTPAEMMTAWKCGYDCSGHSKTDTRKWVSDVEMYFQEVDEED